MIFKINGILKGPELDAFRILWTDYTEAENEYLTNGGNDKVSSAQQFVIDLFTGHEGPYTSVPVNMNQAETELEAVLPAQMELEALFRARSRALAGMLGHRALEAP